MSKRFKDVQTWKSKLKRLRTIPIPTLLEEGVEVEEEEGEIEEREMLANITEHLMTNITVGVEVGILKNPN